jgi:hypothetical protein
MARATSRLHKARVSTARVAEGGGHPRRLRQRGPGRRWRRLPLLHVIKPGAATRRLVVRVAAVPGVRAGGLHLSSRRSVAGRTYGPGMAARRGKLDNPDGIITAQLAGAAKRHAGRDPLDIGRCGRLVSLFPGQAARSPCRLSPTGRASARRRRRTRPQPASCRPAAGRRTRPP